MAVAKGRKLHDKREALRHKEDAREMRDADVTTALRNRKLERDPSRLGQNLVDHAARFDAGQAGVEPLVLEREPHVVDPHLGQQSRVNVVDRRAVFGRVIAEFVGRPVAEARA